MPRKPKTAPPKPEPDPPQEGAEVKKDERVHITPPNFRSSRINIEGEYLCINRFSEKAKRKIAATQAKGSRAKKGEIREKRDPKADFEGAKYVSREGWLGLPASSFRNAAIAACRLCGFSMVLAKLSLFIDADGYDKIDGTPLVKITGKPIMNVMAVRPDKGGADLRYRPLWEEWSAKPLVRWDNDQFSSEDILNLFTRMGMQVGVGEGRANSRKSAGIGWGFFKVKL
jgi:hypothetical protein